MKPVGVGEHINEKYRILFHALATGVEWKGVSGMEFILKNYFGSYEKIQNDSASPLTILYNNTKKLIDRHGIDYVIYLIQDKDNHISKNFTDIVHTKELKEKILHIVSHIFNVSIKDIKLGSRASKRDGLRVYASGTAIKLFSDMCGYSIKEIKDIIPRGASVISWQNRLVSNLDHKHPIDRPILKQYLFCKKELINFILNQ